MKKFFLLLVMMCSLYFLNSSTFSKEDNSSRVESVIQLLKKVNQYTLTHPYIHRNTNKIVESDRTWIRATYYTGVMALYEATGDPDILEQAMKWAKKHEWKEGTDWSLANRLTCGQTYLQLYFLKKDPAMIAPLIEWVDSGKPGSPSSPDIWYLEGGRMWCDSLYTAPPALAMLAKATGNKKYRTYMHEMYADVKDLLYDEEYGLFYRDKRYIDAVSKNGKKVFWSRGNGWVIAGLPRILRYLPEDNPHYPQYVDLYRTMAKAIAHRQGEDGLWRTNLTDPEEYPNPESSGSAFFCYALTWGINHEMLNREHYQPIALKAWKGLTDCVHESGKLGWVQKVGHKPEETNFDSTHEYGVGAFLLAGSEIIESMKN